MSFATAEVEGAPYTELRFHAANDLHRFVGELLEGSDPSMLPAISQQLETSGFHLRITRDLEAAKSYLRERYSGDNDARFGIVASSKDKHLVEFGIPNDFQSTRRMRLGPWYGDDEHAYNGQSCRRLTDCVTEFGAQGLELDATLLAWGSDLIRVAGRWSNEMARGYKRKAAVRDPFQLRINAYRVLLTRGRDACVVFVPPMEALDETYGYLAQAGFRELHERS